MKQLSLEQRYTIHSLRHLPPAQIARQMGKDRSTILREFNRFADTRQAYDPQKAHRAAQQRKTSNAHKLTSQMKNTIREGLAQQWAPDQIAGRAQQQNEPMVCRATIYNYIWRDHKQGGTLYKNLRHASKPYRKRYGKPDGRTKAVQQAKKPSIDQRPVVVADKSRFGDWEIDTVVGPRHRGVVVTITERTTNYVLVEKVADKTAGSVKTASIRVLRHSRLPVHTITSDNGTEFADYEKIAQTLKADFYFAHPYHAWERGANEHNNKLLRQYLPKKADFSWMEPKQIKSYQEALNNRPRKKLNYSTPNEAVKSFFST